MRTQFGDRGGKAGSARVFSQFGDRSEKARLARARTQPNDRCGKARPARVCPQKTRATPLRTQLERRSGKVPTSSVELGTIKVGRFVLSQVRGLSNWVPSSKTTQSDKYPV